MDAYHFDPSADVGSPDPATVDGGAVGAGGSAERTAALTPAEIGKDTAQSVTEAAAAMVGEVTSIVTGAVRAVAGSVGGFATEVFEIRESARRARVDADADGAPPVS